MIKKLTLLALALAAPTTTFASEIAAGTWEFTGGTNLAFGSTTIEVEGTKVSETSRYGLETGFAYYLSPMVGLGAEISYDHTTDKDSLRGTSVESSSYFLGPKLVLDFGVAPQISLFTDLSIGVVGGDVDGTSASGWGWGIGAGMKYFVSRAVSFDLGLKYRALSVDVDVAGTTVATDTADLTVGVGISVYLGNTAPAVVAR
jgi:opacity protein-like surface antigen